MVPLAEEIGIAIDRAPAPWRSQYENLGYSQQEQAESWAAVEAFAQRLRAGPRDDRASEALEPGNAWNGFLEALNGYLNGTSLANTSVFSISSLTGMGRPTAIGGCRGAMVR